MSTSASDARGAVPSNTLRIGTRGSLLARTQTETVAFALRQAHPGLACETTIIRTRGDAERNRPLPEIGGKGLFTEEIERALALEEIDIAVHSLKDLPTNLPDGLTLGAVPERESPFDALISRDGKVLADLPDGARVGTSSLRRAAQLRAVRPDLRIGSLRGNLDTRIRKMETEGWDAIVVAAAGLSRLGRLSEAAELLKPETMLPAVGQGALGIESREKDAATRLLLAAIHDSDTERAVTAERAFLAALGGGCHVPIGAYATVEMGSLTLMGVVASVDGSAVLRDTGAGDDPVAVGSELARRILAMGARAILERAAS
ncbi:hydroxymethylbilane synthase [Candidatus Poribacteria bacterium]|nr:hydroxymethylbilane synthase [Candidatus Poribacteria bacterium]